jgi:hypothetical protein
MSIQQIIDFRAVVISAKSEQNIKVASKSSGP